MPLDRLSRNILGPFVHRLHNPILYKITHFCNWVYFPPQFFIPPSIFHFLTLRKKFMHTKFCPLCHFTNTKIGTNFIPCAVNFCYLSQISFFKTPGNAVGQTLQKYPRPLCASSAQPYFIQNYPLLQLGLLPPPLFLYPPQFFISLLYAATLFPKTGGGAKWNRGWK